MEDIIFWVLLLFILVWAILKASGVMKSPLIWDVAPWFALVLLMWNIERRWERRFFDFKMETLDRLNEFENRITQKFNEFENKINPKIAQIDLIIDLFKETLRKKAE